MQGINIELMKQYTSSAYRVFNHVELFVSFEGVLTLELNGKVTHFHHQIAIVNHNDLVKVTQAQAIVKLTVPLQYFSEFNADYFLGYFNLNKLSSHNKIKEIIKHLIVEENSDMYYENIHTLIKLLYNETFIELGRIYIPHIHVNSILFNNMIDYVHQHAKYRLSLQELSEHFFVSQSYVSILFGKYLDYNFKKYYASMKIAMSMYNLATSHDSINQIATQYSFTNYNHYSKQFKRFVGISPIEFRKQSQKRSYQVTVVPFDIQYFDTHLRKSSTIPSPHKVDIFLDQLTPPQWIEKKEVLLEIVNLDDICQIFGSQNQLEAHHHAHAIQLSFNPSDLETFHFEHTHHIELLSQLLCEYGYKMAYRIHSLQAYEIFKNQFYYPLTRIIEQQPNDFNQYKFKLNIILDHESLSVHEIQTIIEKVKALHPDSQFTLDIALPLTPSKKAQLKLLLQQRIVFDYYMLDALQLNQTYMYHLDLHTQFESKFAQVIQTLRQEYQLAQTPMIIKSVPQLFTAKQHAMPREEQLLKLWLNVDALCLPLISNDSLNNGFYNRFGHRNAIQHVFNLLQPFSHTFSVRTSTYLVHETAYAYEILLFHADQALKNVSFVLYGTNQLHRHFVVEYTYHPTYSNLDHIMHVQTQDYYVPRHFVSSIHMTNHLLFHIQLHHFEHTSYQTTLPQGVMKLIKIIKNKATRQSDML